MEIWADISGFEDKYQASNLGRVRNRNGYILSIRIDSDGYCLVDLWVDRGTGRKTCKVHQLVLTAFKGVAPAGKDTVDHINGVRDDNAIDNLRWFSRANNNRNRKAMGVDGLRGVRFRKDRGNFQAYARINCRFKSLGHFDNATSAVAVRQKFEQEVFNG